jgi:hypothetical protein
MTSKIHIRMGTVEVDFEGTEDFIRNDLRGIIASVSGLPKATSVVSDMPVDIPVSAEGVAPRINGLTTASIAAKLGVNSGPELVIAAAGRLAVIDRQDTYTRQQLLKEMKSAAGYYKKSYRSNLSGSLQRLVSEGKLLETAADTFALAPATKADVSSKLA